MKTDWHPHYAQNTQEWEAGWVVS